MVHRLVSLPLLPQAIAKETDTIKYIAEVNGLNIDVDKLIRKKRIARSLDSTTTLKRDIRKRRWIRLPYLGRLSKKLSQVLRTFDLQPAFYSVNRLCDTFPSPKDPIPILEKSGVYRLECSDCRTFYVGQTGRKLRDRISEHEKAVERHAPERSNFAAHLLDCGHSFSRDGGVRLLHTAGRGRRLTALEEIEIIKHFNSRDLSLANKIIPESKLAESYYTVDDDVTR